MKCLRRQAAVGIALIILILSPSPLPDTLTVAGTAITGPLVPAAVAFQPSLSISPGESLESDAYAEADYDWQYFQIWNLIDKYFLYRDRLHGWSRWKHKFKGRLKSKVVAEKAISKMLDSLKDDYTFYRDVKYTAECHEEEKKADVVQSRMLPAKTGYLRIRNFTSLNVVSDTRKALKKFSKARRLILDLRDNKGGSIESSFRVFSLFCKNGRFVLMRGIDDGLPETEDWKLQADQAIFQCNGRAKIAKRESVLWGNKPLIVLVDGGTKSAAEMLAGALRDNRHSLLVGTRTYGKGIIQRVWEFDNGTSIKITAARYYLPGGQMIHGRGIIPNRAYFKAGANLSDLARNL